MNLSDMERKLLMLAMDASATADEMTVASKKFIESLKKRFPSGVELIKAMESGAVLGGVDFGAPQQQSRGPFPSYTRPFGNEWQDIMREAQRMGQARMAAEAAKRQRTWEEYVRQQQQQNADHGWYQQYGFHPTQKSEPDEPQPTQEEILRKEEEQRKAWKDESLLEKIKRKFDL